MYTYVCMYYMQDLLTMLNQIYSHLKLATEVIKFSCGLEESFVDEMVKTFADKFSKTDRKSLTEKVQEQ